MNKVVSMTTGACNVRLTSVFPRRPQEAKQSVGWPISRPSAAEPSPSLAFPGDVFIADAYSQIAHWSHCRSPPSLSLTLSPSICESLSTSVYLYLCPGSFPLLWVIFLDHTRLMMSCQLAARLTVGNHRKNRHLSLAASHLNSMCHGPPLQIMTNMKTSILTFIHR